MVVYVVFAQFIGVTLVFLVFPIYLIPFLEERFETKLPNEPASAKNHVVIFDYGPAVATLITELEQARHPHRDHRRRREPKRATCLSKATRSFTAISTKAYWRNPISARPAR